MKVGTWHYGTHEDVMAAAEIANRAARERAARKGTCYKAVKIDECKKGEDGRWTCRANSANHPGSCLHSPAGFVGEDPVVKDFQENPQEGPDIDAGPDPD